MTAIQTKPAMTAPPAESPRPHAPRTHSTWAPGDRAHQGDLILVALHVVPRGSVIRRDRQMADGTSPGSRHVVTGGQVYDADKSVVRKALKEFGIDVDEKYIGPVFQGPCTLEHPTHAHQVFPDKTATAVVYQRNLDAEEREVRARD